MLSVTDIARHLPVAKIWGWCLYYSEPGPSDIGTDLKRAMPGVSQLSGLRSVRLAQQRLRSVSGRYMNVSI